MRLGWLALLTLCCALFSLGVGRFQVPMTHSLMILLEPSLGSIMQASTPFSAR